MEVACAAARPRGCRTPVAFGNRVWGRGAPPSRRAEQQVHDDDVQAAGVDRDRNMGVSEEDRREKKGMEIGEEDPGLEGRNRTGGREENDLGI